MGLDDTVNLERLAKAMERIATAFDQYNILYSERLCREYPPERIKRAAEVINPVSDKREQYSDKASDEWASETEAAVPSRFQKRLNEQTGKKSEPKRRSDSPVH